MSDFNAANRKSIREAEKAAKLAEVQRGDVVRNICSTEPGRRYLWDRLGEAGIFIAVPATDALHMAYAEGARAQGLALLNDITTHCPEQFILMMREANERYAQRASAGQSTGGEDTGGGVDRPDSEVGFGADEDGAGEEGRTH